MAENVKVAVRVRPFNSREKERNAKMCITMDGPKTSIENPEDKKIKDFTFDFSYNSFVPRDAPNYASQADVWADIGVGVLKNAYEGFNCSLFAYGQTGAGKSYSMMGYGPDKGIIPLAAERIFNRIHENTDEDLTFRVETSMLEIYMEKVRDLFNPSAGDSLKVRNDPKKGFYVEQLAKMAVDGYEKIEKLMEAGSKARTVASTNMNATSSRAHTIFQIILTQTKVNREAGKATDKTALINLIDLAGSERQTGTGATGDRLKEGSAINLSLSSLGNCISALAANSSGKKKKRVPYRDSVLTMLLQNSLGGNAKTIMIAAVSPADINYDETLGTLRYADRAKQIKNKAVVNEDPNEKLIRNLKSEVAELRKKLAMTGGEGGDMSGLLEEEREKMKAERDAEIERVRKELEEKLRQEMEESKSWEDRLKETESATAAAEASLAQMGVATSADREAILKRAATDPHISNLNEDPQMNGQMIHFFDEGKTVTFGRKDAPTKPDVIMGGLSIEREHCTITMAGGVITLTPNGTAKTNLNSEAVGSAVELHHLDRLIFGNNHVYKVVVPAEAEAGVAARGIDEGEEVPTDEQIDWEYAVREMNKAQIAAMAEEEARRKAEADAEAAKAAEQVRAIEEKMKAEMEAAEKEAAEKRAYYEAMEARLKKEAEEMKANSSGEAMEKMVKEQEEKEKAARAEFEAEQEKMRKAQAELEQKLQDQIKETERMARQKQREMRERSLLDEKLLKTIPLVNEANAISDELEKHMSFSVKLMANQSRARAAAKAGAGGKLDESDDEKGSDDEESAESTLDTEVFVRVEYADPEQPVSMWHYDKFMNRLYMMREMYTAWVEVGRDLTQLEYTDEDDPFFDPIEAQLVGRSTIYLDSLCYCLSIKEATPIIDYKGKEEGELLVRIVPHLTEHPPATEEEEDEQEIADNIQQLKGKKLGITIFVDGARGLPASRSTGVYVRFRFFLDDDEFETPPCEFKTINPRFTFQHTFWPVVTDELCRYVNADAIEFEVYGNIDKEGKAPARPVTAAAQSRAELDKIREQLRTAQVERDEKKDAENSLQNALKEREEEIATLKRKLENAEAAAASGTTPGGGGDKGREQQLEAENKKKADEIAKLKRELEEAKAKSGACIIL